MRFVILLALVLFVNSWASAPTVSPQRFAVLEQQYRVGEKWHRIGRLMGWGGLGACVAGAASGQGALISLGVLSLLGSVPINGWGSGDMVDAVNKMEPRGHVMNVGWWPVGISMGLALGGVALTMNADSYKDAEGDTHYNGNVMGIGEMELGTGMFIAGTLGLVLSANLYTLQAEEARVTRSYIKLSASPLVLRTHENSGFAHGLLLSANF